MYTTSGACPDFLELQVTTLDEEFSSFELTPTCDGATANILGDTGGIFSFVDGDPGDGAVIDATTGEITLGAYDTTYNVMYTTAGLCPSVTELPVTTLVKDDPSFELTATCDGATANIIGDTGGTFSFAG